MKQLKNNIKYLLFCFLFVLPTQVFSALTLTVQVNPDPVRQGEMMFVKYTVTNTGTTPLFGLVLQTEFPAGLNSLSESLISDLGNCTSFSCEPGEQLIWNLGNIGPGASMERTLPTVVANATTDGTSILFEAEVTDAGSGSASVSHNVIVNSQRAFDLAVDADFNPVASGAILTYDLTYGNRTAATASAVQLSMPLPSGLTLVSVSGGGSLVGSTLQWPLGTLTAGAVGYQQVIVQVDSAKSDGDIFQIENAQISGTVNFVATTTKAMRTSRVDNSLPIKLALAANPNPVLPGQLINVALTVTNPTNSPLFGVQLQVRFPTGLNSLSESIISDAGNCISFSCEPGEILSWNIGTLPPSASRIVSFPPIVAAAVSSGKVSTFEVEVVNNNNDSVSTSQSIVVDSIRGLDLEMANDINPVAAGNNLVYSLSYGNRSGVSATDTKLSFPLPKGTSLVYATGDGLLIGDKVEWALGNFTAGAVDRQQLTLKIDDTLPDAELLRVNAAHITGNINFLPTSTRAVNNTRVDDDVPLLLSLATNVDPVIAGQVMNVALTVTNPTISPLLGVNLQLRFPSGFQSLSESIISDTGDCISFSCEAGEILNWNIGTLGPTASVEVDFPASILATLATGSVRNIYAEVTNANGDSASSSQTFSVDNIRIFDLALDTDQNPVTAGKFLTYAITYGNSSAASASDVMLSFPLPSNVTLISATGDGELVEGAVEWELGVIGAGKGGRQLVTVEVDSALVDGELLAVDAAEISGVANFLATSTRAQRSTRVDSHVPLQISLSSDPNPVLPGQPLNMQLHVSNTSTTGLLGVVLQLRYPVGLASLSETQIPGGDCISFSCEPNEIVTWNIGTLAAGSNVSFSLSPTTLSALSSGRVLFLNAEVLDANRDSASASQSILIGDFLDTDGDGIANLFDNCLSLANPDQLDTDFDGLGNICDADFNNNCIIDASDFTFLKSKIFTQDPNADLNGNGIVDAADFTRLKNQIFQSPGPSGYGSCRL